MAFATCWGVDHLLHRILFQSVLTHTAKIPIKYVQTKMPPFFFFEFFISTLECHLALINITFQCGYSIVAEKICSISLIKLENLVSRSPLKLQLFTSSTTDTNQSSQSCFPHQHRAYRKIQAAQESSFCDPLSQSSPIHLCSVKMQHHAYWWTTR